MKRIALGVAAGVGLIGCASLPAPSADLRPDGYLEPDTERMAIVERRAVRLGVRIIWVNPPLKSASNPG